MTTTKPRRTRATRMGKLGRFATSTGARYDLTRVADPAGPFLAADGTRYRVERVFA